MASAIAAAILRSMRCRGPGRAARPCASSRASWSVSSRAALERGTSARIFSRRFRRCSASTASPERFRVSIARSKAANSSGRSDIRSRSAPDGRLPALAPFAIGSGGRIRKLRFQCTQHALARSLRHVEALDHIIEGHTCAARRDKRGESKKLLSLPKRHRTLTHSWARSGLVTVFVAIALYAHFT